MYFVQADDLVPLDESSVNHGSRCGYTFSVHTMYCIAGFFEDKIFTNWPFLDFQGENFHESSWIVRSTY